MTVETPVPTESLQGLLQRVGGDCFSSVLSQIAGAPVTVELESEQETKAADAIPDESGVWTLFTLSKALNGQMAILSVEAGALPLAQLLTQEPIDPAIPFDKDRRDAYEELLRQVIGLMASGLRGPARGEVEIKLSGNTLPEWPGATRTGIRVTGNGFPAIRLVFVVTPELTQSFRLPDAESQPAPPANAAQTASARQPEIELTPTRSANLELLLDVKLDATIRFGQRQMLLREVLELHPGVAIALNRKVEEPVELLVGGRMVARGEVVIVNGNYGLRITEIASPQQRIESLRTLL